MGIFEGILYFGLAFGIFTGGAQVGKHIERQEQAEREEARAKSEQRVQFILKTQSEAYGSAKTNLDKLKDFKK